MRMGLLAPAQTSSNSALRRTAAARRYLPRFCIAGKGIANPVAAFWTAAQMLDHLGETLAAARLMAAAESVFTAGTAARRPRRR